MKQFKRQEKRRMERNQPEPTPPFRVKAILVKAEAEFYDPLTKEATGRAMTEEVPLFEKESAFKEVLKWLKDTKGFTPTEEMLNEPGTDT